MKEGWKYITLSELCRVQNGYAFDSKKFNEEHNGLPLVRIRDIKRGYSQTYTTETCADDFFVEDGEMLIGMDGDFNLGEWKGGHALLNQRVCKLIPSTDLLAKFLYYYLPEALQKINDKTAFSTVKHLSSKQVNNIQIPEIPLSSQQEIVAYLDSAFAKIDRLKENAEKSLSEAKALFQSALKEMMQPKEGWEEMTLSNICRVINGRAYLKPEMLKEGKYKILRVGNFFTNDSWYYSDLELEEDKYCEDGDLLYAWSASFGPRIWRGEKVIYHYHIWKMICNAEIDKYFMYYWLDSDELKKQAMTNLHGATMNHITKNIMEHCIVAFPDKPTQHSIVTTLDALSSKVSALEANYTATISECNALKQALLKQVFEGK